MHLGMPCVVGVLYYSRDYASTVHVKHSGFCPSKMGKIPAANMLLYRPAPMLAAWTIPNRKAHTEDSCAQLPKSSREATERMQQEPASAPYGHEPQKRTPTT
jgi:hypothetical protein